MLAALKMQVIHANRLVRHALRDVGVDHKRSDKWPKVEKDFRAKNAKCAACGGEVRLNVHHKQPFHLNPALELDETNLVTLCMGLGHDCHLLIGHGDDFKAYNPNIAAMVEEALKLNVAGDTAGLAKLEETAKATRRYSLLT